MRIMQSQQEMPRRQNTYNERIKRGWKGQTAFQIPKNSRHFVTLKEWLKLPASYIESEFCKRSRNRGSCFLENKTKHLYSLRRERIQVPRGPSLKGTFLPWTLVRTWKVMRRRMQFYQPRSIYPDPWLVKGTQKKVASEEALCQKDSFRVRTKEGTQEFFCI